MEVDRLDHLVLTVKDVESTCDFYVKVLGMQVALSPHGPTALTFGHQKINLHELGREFDPKAIRPIPGSADLCFIINTPLARALAHVQSCGVEIVEGPVPRLGALGAMQSFYFRDPDGNLVEVASYDTG